ncbi:hypothetical protein HYALB_00000965 [Hymenoscyphus albidus]|uniref:ABC transporter domain-containing protein n=1 Tax=Hymenoscyphus albidus TaxID=595503 RepID=A0A9N9LWS0_9HELO|nr:hypothetical protein HYALB_00000965 [Hymenoscyphus albidus]
MTCIYIVVESARSATPWNREENRKKRKKSAMVWKAEQRKFEMSQKEHQQQQKLNIWRLGMRKLYGCSGLLICSLVLLRVVYIHDRYMAITVLLETQRLLQQLLKLYDSVGTFQKGWIDCERIINIEGETPNQQNIVYIRPTVAFDTVIGSVNLLNRQCNPISHTKIDGLDSDSRWHLIKVLRGIEKLTWGTIRLDHQDITTYSSQALRESIGILPSKFPTTGNDTCHTFLLNGFDYNEDEIRAACIKVNIDKKIQSFSSNYSTYITALTKQELRRLGLARLLLQRTELWVLDGDIIPLDDTEIFSLSKTLNVVFDSKTVITLR